MTKPPSKQPGPSLWSAMRGWSSPLSPPYSDSVHPVGACYLPGAWSICLGHLSHTSPPPTPPPPIIPLHAPSKVMQTAGYGRLLSWSSRTINFSVPGVCSASPAYWCKLSANGDISDWGKDSEPWSRDHEGGENHLQLHETEAFIAIMAINTTENTRGIKFEQIQFSIIHP